jgi:lambda family phage minor tail protein L
MSSDKKLSDFPKVIINRSKQSGEKIVTQMGKVAPSAVVTLYEIDLEDLLIDESMPYLETTLAGEAVFRFHNNLKLTKQKIYWKGEEYHPLPISVEGFDSSTRSSTPTPRMSMMSNEKEDQQSMFKDFKTMVRKLDDLIGAKVTRVRTFAKYLDLKNFYDIQPGGGRVTLGDDTLIPEGFAPDPLAEFPREVFFINRKSVESKNGLEFELGSFIDFENLKLPMRLVISRYCQFQYRGEGCIYEYEQVGQNMTNDQLESAFGTDSFSELKFPCKAPPLANENDELFIDKLGTDYRPQQAATAYDPERAYSIGENIYITKNDIKYYFIAKDAVPAASTAQGGTLSTIPPNNNYWLEDKCSKTIKGCKLRWSDEYKRHGDVRIFGTSTDSMIGTSTTCGVYSMSNPCGGCGTNTHAGCLPFGGFPAVEKLHGSE